MKINRKIILVVCGLIFLLSVLVPYWIEFGFSYSSKHSRWGELGSYLAGTFGTFFTLLSILYVYFSNKSQHEENYRISELNRKEEKVSSITYHILNIYDKEVNMELIVPRLCMDVGWKLKDIKILNKGGGLLVVCNEKEELELKFKTGNCFDVLKSYVKLVGKEKAIKAFYNDDIGMFRSDLKSFNASVTYLIELLTMMFNHKYDCFLAKHTVSIFFEQAHFLMLIDCFDKNTFSRISMISSIPHANRSFNIPEGMINNLVKELNERSKVDVKLKNAQLKGSRGYDLESGVYEFDIYDKKTKKTYRRTTKKEWKELD